MQDARVATMLMLLQSDAGLRTLQGMQGLLRQDKAALLNMSALVVRY